MPIRKFMVPIATACLAALLGLAGCSQAGEGKGSQEEAPQQEAVSQVSAAFGSEGDEVTIEVPTGWEVDESGSVVAITPDEFDGNIQLGASINPMSAFTSDEEVLSYFESNVSGVSGDWERVSEDDDASPVYQAALDLEGGKESKGYIRVAITGDDAVSIMVLASGEDWLEAQDELNEVVSTFEVGNPKAPNYSDSEPAEQDVFTIVSAQRGRDLGYGYWELDVTVRNNSDEAKNFLGFHIDELDASGNIINSYMSYNKNSMPTVVEPGQTLTITLTEAEEDGIAGMQSRYCEWGEDISTAVESEYSEPFKTMF